MVKKILSFFINKYFLITVAFIIWLLFFDSNNILNRLHYQDKFKELKQEKHFYLDEIRNDSVLTRKLLNDSLELEKFAREKYLMKKDKEDVFIMIDSTADRRQ
jgi:cell division protein DivIC